MTPVPTLNIKDPAVYQLAAELAERRSTSMTGAVREALEEAVARAKKSERGTAEEILALALCVRDAGDGAARLHEADLYDDRGLPR